jgi:hypothetical protein
MVKNDRGRSGKQKRIARSSYYWLEILVGQHGTRTHNVKITSFELKRTELCGAAQHNVHIEFYSVTLQGTVIPFIFCDFIISLIVYYYQVTLVLINDV